MNPLSIFSKAWLKKATEEIGSVGDLKHSLLTEAQFQEKHGTAWVLCDGRNVAGSSYSTLTGNSVLPDARGVALRGKNNGRSDGNENPDGELGLGDYQADGVGGHDHDAFIGTDTGGSNRFVATNNTNQGTNTVAIQQSGTNIVNETRMKNITVNIFVKIN